MNYFERKLLSDLTDYEEQFGLKQLFEEVIGLTGPEAILEMYNAGLIPEDVVESFLEE